MSAIIAQLKSFFGGFNGILVKEYNYINDPELIKFEKEFLSDEKLTHFSADKVNRKRDKFAVLSDLRTVVRRKSVSM